MSDPMTQGIEFTVVGLSIVFGVLVIIACFVALMRKLDTLCMKRDESVDTGGASERPNLDDLTAVLIASAVSTLLQGRARIRSVRQVQSGGSARSPWSLQARASLHGIHVISRAKNRK